MPSHAPPACVKTTCTAAGPGGGDRGDGARARSLSDRYPPVSKERFPARTVSIEDCADTSGYRAGVAAVGPFVGRRGVEEGAGGEENGRTDTFRR